ncbi:tripartite tricarboxylate transporter substrate-binding protein [Bacillus gobiensis]|uniref:tripartite tricarboxylate transporter substrate-binding protein n=1 Tax=Bacillus gobiensis TaxID=1441095 RepID=UPI003D22255B
MKKIWTSMFFIGLIFIGGSQMPSFQLPFSNSSMEIVVPAEPGGSWDMTARAMKTVIDSNHFFKKPIQIKYITGEDEGWKYLQKRNGHVISLNSSLLLSNNLLGKGTVRYDEFHPLAILTKEWHVTAVPKDSKLKSAADLISALKKNPGQLKIGFAPSIGNDDQLSFVKAVEMAGISTDKLQFLQYNNSNDLFDALANDEIDVASGSVNEALAHFKANHIEILVTTSEKRIKSLPNVPTWREEGIDFVFAHWRGIMGSDKMTKEEIMFWDEVMNKMVKKEEWEKLLQKNNWEPFYKNSWESKDFLKEQNKYYHREIEGTP